MKNSFPCSKIWRKSPKIEKNFSEPPETGLFFYKSQGIKIFALAISRQNPVVNIPYHKCEPLLMFSRLRGSLRRWSVNPADFLKNISPQPKILGNGGEFRLWTKFLPSLQKVLAVDEKIKLLGEYNFWGNGNIDTGFPRTLYTAKISQYLGNRLVKVLCGQRRVGKSYILRQMAKELIESHSVAPQNTFMLNKDIVAFDFVADYRGLDELFRAYLKEIAPKGKVFLFLDEVQNIEGWEKFVDSYSQDYTREYEIFITGSNSKMLSGELATMLSGRYVAFEVMPFSFEEYTAYKGLVPGRSSYIEYLGDGGLPELLNLSGQEARRNYVMSLKDTIMMRDIVGRYQIKDPGMLEDLFVYLVNNTSSLFSANNLVKYYKSRGKAVSYDKVSQYIRYLTYAYLLHRVERYDIRGKATLSGVCKYYVNDMAFHNYLYRGVAHGAGYDLENVVYLDFRRHGYDVYVGTLHGKEVDFVAMKNDRVIYVQVAYMLIDEATIQSEYAPLRAIGDNYEKIVVSLDDIARPSDGGIRNIRAWEIGNVL